jgi:hypothetical protein
LRIFCSLLCQSRSSVWSTFDSGRYSADQGFSIGRSCLSTRWEGAVKQGTAYSRSHSTRSDTLPSRICCPRRQKFEEDCPVESRARYNPWSMLSHHVAGLTRLTSRSSWNTSLVAKAWWLLLAMRSRFTLSMFLPSASSYYGHSLRLEDRVLYV